MSSRSFTFAAAALVLLGGLGFVVWARRKPSPPVIPPASIVSVVESAAPASRGGQLPEPVAVTFPSGPYKLRGYLMKPAGDGPFPVVVYNHGSEQDPSLQFQGDLGRFFQKEGYIAFFPYRRGASGSEGPYWEDEIKRQPGTDRARKIVDQLEVENADVVAALAWVRQQPGVDARRIAVAGCSFGGIHTLLASEKATAAYAAVDFAGASMSWETSEPLQQRLKVAARAAQIPVFFVQAENDFNTTPSRVLSAEMDAVHKPHRMKIFPPHGTTPMAGHAHFCNHGMKEWGPEVLAFLRAPPAP